MSDDPRRYYVGFNLVKGIGSARLKALIDHYGDIEKAWNAPVQSLNNSGLGGKLIQNFLKIRSQIDLNEVWKRIENSGISVLTWDDLDPEKGPIYPLKLREIELPPPVIYLKGTIIEDDEWAVAIVGTRRVTAYGRQLADEVSRSLARNGVTVVSGLAKGVDSIAHQSALSENGRTIAVLGSGVDRIYPIENSRMAEKISHQGAVVSDYPPGTPPESTNFPPRNRIISALAKAVIVIEADEGSGALITAAFAVEQGKDVFAVPGNIHAPQSRGTNRLIQNGARLLMDPDEVLELLNMTQVINQRAVRSVLPIDATEAKLVSVLNKEPQHIDEIRLKLGLPIDQVSAVLTIMELKGYAKQVGGMNFIAVRDYQTEYEI